MIAASARIFARDGRLTMKKILLILAAVVILLIVVVIALPFFINANQFKPKLESQLTMALGRQVTIGNIQLALLAGGVTVDDVSIADDPAFSTMPFLQAKQLTAGVAMMPLIMSKKLQVSTITITDPSVSLLRTGAGKWNYSTLGSGAKSQSSSDPDTDISVQKLTIDNGTMTVGTVGPGGKTQTYQAMKFEATDLSYTSQIPFKLSAQTPGDGKVTVDGKAGPIDQKDTSLTPLDATIGVEGVDLASTGFVAANSGFGGMLDFNGTLASDGKQITSKGTVKATKLKLSPNGAPASVPVNVDYTTAYDLKGHTGTLTQGDVHVGNALSHLSGTYDLAGTDAKIMMKLNGSGMSVPDLEGVLPAVGVTLPQGASLQTGTLTTNLALNGPVDKLVITGPINLANAKMAGFNLKQKLGALSSFTGLGGSGGGSDTEIQSLTADLRVDPSGTNANNLKLVVAGLGTVTGNGTVSASGQLNCKMVANLQTAGAAGDVLSTISTFTGGGGSGGKNNGIPFTITGTTSHPVFVPDVKGLLGNQLKSRAGNADGAAGAAAGILGGLFGKKK
jgi:AsmA protein